LSNCISQSKICVTGKRIDVSDILPSIRKHGILQTLITRPEGDGFGVVAGSRRFTAELIVASETDEPRTVPCYMMQEGDDAEAIEKSMIENMTSLPPTELEQFKAFKNLKIAGRSVEDIAQVFGVTDLKVKRTLALSNLKPQILKLYGDEKIEPQTIRALTMATKAQQAEWLDMVKDENQHAPIGRQIKAWLTGGARISTDAALFDLESYQGETLGDLFGDKSYFADPDMFWEYQNTAIANDVAAYREAGWQDIVILDKGERFTEVYYSQRPMEADGKVFVEVGHDGSVTYYEGYITNSDANQIEDILYGSDEDETPKPPKVRPEMSKPLEDYVSLHRHAMARAVLLTKTKVALRLATAHMLSGSSLWNVSAHSSYSAKDATRESVAASISTREFETEREAVREILGLGYPDSDLISGTNDVVAVFFKLLCLSDKQVNQVLTFAMAESLSESGGIVEAIATVIDIDSVARWEPDEAYFELLHAKHIVNAQVADIAGERTANMVVTDTGKAQKQLIRNRMAGHGVSEATPDWRPRWMQFPATSYLEADDAQPAVRSRRTANAYKAYGPKTNVVPIKKAA
jgi:ParB family chromosome partitioning protein